jgi:hypothetical protein
MAKTLTLSIRLALRRWLGLIVILLDAILDEAAAQLEANLIHAPSAITGVGASIEPGQSLTPSQNWNEWWVHTLLLMLGILIGKRMNSAPRQARIPTRLRVV